jgi:hypothetical protein
MTEEYICNYVELHVQNCTKVALTDLVLIIWSSVLHVQNCTKVALTDLVLIIWSKLY